MALTTTLLSLLMAFPGHTHAVRLCGKAVTAPELDVGNDVGEVFVTCVDVAAEAWRQAVDPTVAVALSYNETRLRPGRISAMRAVGPLQVIPRYWCPNREAAGCNLTRAGVRALKAYHERHGRWHKALCHYNAGNVCGEKGMRYASYILYTARRLRALL